MKPGTDELRVCDILATPALSVLPEESVDTAERRLDTIGAHHLLVVQGDTLHGVLCTCDLMLGAPGTPVRVVMTDKPLVIDARSSLSFAAAVMDHRDVNCLPCHWEGSWGLLTRGDLVRAGVAERRTCVACGAHHHVRPRTADGTAWCRNCYDPRFSLDDVATLYRDLGEAG